MIKKCRGCGILLQVDDSSKLGYCKNIEQDLCMRCYQIKHFNKLPDLKLDNIEFEKMLYEVGKTKKTIIWVFDLFDFNGSYLKGISKYLNGNKVILVGNKKDLLPKSLSENKIKHWFIDSIDDDINVVDVLLTSAVKKFNVDKLLDLIDEFSTGDVYIVGATNTGKSSLVNAIVKSLYPNKKDVITTSYYAGTTLSTISIPIDDYTTLVDTPGIVNDFQVTNYLETGSLKKIIPVSEVKQRIYQLNSSQTVFISGLFRMDFVSGERSIFAFFVSKNIELHRTKLENADSFYQKHICSGPLVPPTESEYATLPKLEAKVIKINEGRVSIGMAGMGYFNVVANSDIEIVMHAPKGVLVDVRKNMEGVTYD